MCAQKLVPIFSSARESQINQENLNFGGIGSWQYYCMTIEIWNRVFKKLKNFDSNVSF